MNEWLIVNTIFTTLLHDLMPKFSQWCVEYENTVMKFTIYAETYHTENV
jgi:hypothetical protein